MTDTYSLLKELNGPQPELPYQDIQVILGNKRNAPVIKSSPQTNVIFDVRHDGFVDFGLDSTALAFPIVTTVTQQTAKSKATRYCYMDVVAPKPLGFGSYIYSMGLSINNVTVVSATRHLHLFNFLRYQRETSQNYHNKVAALMGMASGNSDDEVLSWYIAGADDGAITSHNSSVLSLSDNLPIIRPITNSTSSLAEDGAAGRSSRVRYQNSAFAERCRLLAAAKNRASQVMARNYVEVSSTLSNGDADIVVVRTYKSNAWIPLKHVHPIFQEMGLVKGEMSFDMQLTFSNVEGLVPVPAFGAAAYPGGAAVSTGYTFTSGACPIMVSETASAFNNTTNNIYGAIGGLLQSPEVSKADADADYNAFAIPTEAFSTVSISSICAEQRGPDVYLTEVKPYEKDQERFSKQTKTINYLEHNIFEPTSAYSGTSTIQETMINNILGVQRLTVLAYLDSTKRVSGLTHWNDCATPVPYYPDPCCVIQDAKLTINGKNLALRSTQDAGREYAEQVGVFGINDGQDSHVASGLFTKKSNDVCRHYVFELARYNTGGALTAIFEGTNSSLSLTRLVGVIETMSQLTLTMAPGASTAVDKVNYSPPVARLAA